MCIFVKASLMMVIRVYYSWTGERRFGKEGGEGGWVEGETRRGQARMARTVQSQCVSSQNRRCCSMPA